MDSSLIPVKCITCGKVLADKYRIYAASKEKGSPTTYFGAKSNEKTAQGRIMDELGLTRSCCRRHMLGHVGS